MNSTQPSERILRAADYRRSLLRLSHESLVGRAIQLKFMARRRQRLIEQLCARIEQCRTEIAGIAARLGQAERDIEEAHRENARLRERVVALEAKLP